MTKAEKIFNRLKQCGIVEASGKITMTMLNVSFEVSEKSALGDILQEWLKNWLDSEHIYYRVNPNTQEPPDFYLSDSDDKDLLEVKVFDYSASPNFDVANFDTYIRALIDKPQKINSDYLIMGYELNDASLTIKQIWLKKIWEICRSSNKFPINTQCKQGKIYNIRPATWYATKPTYPTFQSRTEFMQALNSTINAYQHLSSEIDKNSWLNTVADKYKITTGERLL